LNETSACARISENKKKSKSRFTEITTKIEDWKLKFAMFENFTNHGDSIKKMVKVRKKNACMAVKRGVRVRRNCNVFNLAIENVLKGLPDKIRDQLSRHHTQMHFKSNEMYKVFNHFQIARSWR
jgi:hypothetical protein